MDAPALPDDPFDPAVLVDPYEMHERIREAGPVVYLSHYGIWAMGRHAEVRQALDDWETYSSASGVGLADFRKEPPWRPPSLLLEADPPAHTGVRKPTLSLMTPKVVKALREAFEPPAHALAEQLVGQGHFDGVKDLAEVYPVQVFADAVGLPQEGREHLLPYAAMVFNGFGPKNALRDAAFADPGPVLAWVGSVCRRGTLAPGGLGAQIWEEADRGEITAEQAPLLVRSLLAAGLDTTVYALGNALWCLATHPGEYAKLRADPAGRARGAFEEALRFEAAVQTFFRTTTRAVDVGGCTIPAGEKVLLFLAAANRDPRRWGPDAGRFDIGRRCAGHVTFGHGIHVCVGQFVARLEGELVLQALAERAATIELAGPAVPSPNNTLKGYRSLPLAVG